MRRTVSFTVSSRSPDLLADRDLADHAGRLADLGLLAGGEHLDRLALERGVRLLGAQLAVGRLALGLDLLLAQGDGLLDRLLADAGGHPHAAGRDLALADRELLLDLLHRLALLRGRLAAGALVALDDRHRLVELLVGRLGDDQGLAAADRLGVAAGVVLVEAVLDDLGQDLLLAALEHLDVLLLEGRP